MTIHYWHDAKAHCGAVVTDIDGATVVVAGVSCPACLAMLSTHVESAVEHPPHYAKGAVECIDAIASALTPEEFAGFCKGNVLKYTWRERNKGGDEDLQKAKWYMEKLLSKRNP